VRATAYHEAGHAVANVALGLAINKVSIIPGEDHHGLDYTGICVSPGVLDYHYPSAGVVREQRAVARAHIVACYAGMAAQRLVDPHRPDEHAAGDEENAMELSRLFGVFPRGCSRVGDEAHLRYLDKLRAEARRLVRKHWRAVAELAEELLQCEVLSGPEAEKIIRPLLNSPP
jgi:hypothetical protein